MQISKIPIPANTQLVEIITSEYEDKSHMIYFLGSDGSTVMDPIHVKDAYVSEIISKIGHMCIVQFTDKQMYEISCKCMFNGILGPAFIPYDKNFAWTMDEEMVNILRHFCKIKQVRNYTETKEYANEVHILDDFIYAKPTPIERSSDEVHARGIESRTKFLEYIKFFCI